MCADRDCFFKRSLKQTFKIFLENEFNEVLFEYSTFLLHVDNILHFFLISSKKSKFKI